MRSAKRTKLVAQNTSQKCFHPRNEAEQKGVHLLQLALEEMARAGRESQKQNPYRRLTKEEILELKKLSFDVK
jgi:hypothetical protein